MSDIKSQVSSLLVGVCGTDEILAEPDLDLFEDGLLDSMGFVELLYGLETELEVVISPTEVDRDDVSTVNKIVALVSERS